MRLLTYFIFSPTAELIEAAAVVGESQLIETTVWTTYESDRTGLEHSKKDMENAFWAIFQANIFYQNETDLQRRFRDQCNVFGFDKCWSVVQTTGGGTAEELFDSAREAVEFLKLDR